MARSAVSLTLLAVALALALSLASFAEARGGKNGIPDSVVGVDSRMGSKKTSSSSLTDDPNPACDVCRWAWTNAQAALADPETQAQVMRFAEETACGVLPSQEAQKCKEMAREYIPNAIAALESFDADEACGAVGFCPPQKDNAGEEEERETRRVIREALVSSVLPRATSSAFLTSTLSPRLGGPACPACRLALNSVKLQLEDPANQEQLLDKAHQVCSTLPADSAELCVSAVDDNAAKLFAIVADFDCNTLCVVAGACPPPDPPTSSEQEIEEEEVEVGNEKEDDLLHPTVLSLPSPSSPVINQLSDDPDLCSICTSVLSQLHDAVTDPEKQREAMATAARICSALHKFRDECLGDVQQYGPIVINTVGQYVGPDLCAAAGLCSGLGSSCARSKGGEKKSSAERTVDVA